MLDIENEFLLDNAPWHALNSEQAHFSIGNDLAKRYIPDVWVLVGLPGYKLGNFAALENIVAVDEVVFGGGFPASALPPNWKVLDSAKVMQMICPQTIINLVVDKEPILLSPQNLPDIMALIDLTQPGPIGPRTLEMGAYLGMFKTGKLIAMAGERMSLANFCEISAVCTHPGFQGHGYARFLVSRLVNNIFDRKQIPFLHVMSTNVGAIALYHSLGFYTRLEIPFYVFQRLA